MSEFELGISRPMTSDEQDLNADGFKSIFDKTDADKDIHQGKVIVNTKNREILKGCKNLEEVKNLKLMCFRCWKISKKLDNEKFNSDPQECVKDFSNLKFVDFRKNTERGIKDGMKMTLASGVDLKFRCPVCKAMQVFSFEMQEIGFNV